MHRPFPPSSKPGRSRRTRRDDLTLLAPIDLDIDHPPSLAVAEGEVRRAVAALAAAGAVSAETPEALDTRIDSWCDQWIEQLRVQHTRTHDAAVRLLGTAEADVERLSLMKLRAELHLARAEDDRERAGQRLGLGPVTLPQPAGTAAAHESEHEGTEEEEIA